MIERWFSTPLFVVDLEKEDLEEIQEEIKQALPDIRQSCSSIIQNGSVATTFNFANGSPNDIEDFKLVKFKREIEYQLNEYIKSIKYKGAPLELINSWTTFYNKGGCHFDHIHPLSRVSGCYYYQTNGSDGNIIFMNPNPHAHTLGFPSDGVKNENVNYAPKVGRLIFFPSWLIHRVDMNCTDNERISLAFNFE
jgi:uncharacterized protein (TIGR02466 family)